MYLCTWAYIFSNRSDAFLGNVVAFWLFHRNFPFAAYSTPPPPPKKKSERTLLRYGRPFQRYNIPMVIQYIISYCVELSIFARCLDQWRALVTRVALKGPVTKVIVHDWGIKSTMALGCRTVALVFSTDSKSASNPTFCFTNIELFLLKINVGSY
jgi:hypothetical protein